MFFRAELRDVMRFEGTLGSAESAFCAEVSHTPVEPFGSNISKMLSATLLLVFR